MVSLHAADVIEWRHAPDTSFGVMRHLTSSRMLRIRTLGATEITVGADRIGPTQRSAFVLIFLLATRSPGVYSRRELASLLWPEGLDRDRNHRLRSLLHRLRRFGAMIRCEGAHVALDEVALDFAAFTRLPRSLPEVRDRVSLIGPVLPNLNVTTPAALADRLDDERDVIVATLTRWLRTAFQVATSGGEWPLVEELARLTIGLDESSADAWLRLAEAHLVTCGNAAALRTLDEYETRIAPRETSIAARLLRERIERTRVAAESNVGELPLIGRDDIMRCIWSAIARSAEGSGGASVVWGPAGIGKTRVLREVHRVRMIDSVRVIRVAARPVHALRPFGLVVELIARLLEEPGAIACDPSAFMMLRRIVEEPNDGRDEADRYFDAFTELLAALAEEATTLVSMDDMHVVDKSIWRFWGAVFRWSNEHRVHWLLGYRALQEGELDSLPEENLLRRLALSCLDRAGAASLVDAARRRSNSGELDRFFPDVGGQPALLAALARSEGELPPWTEGIVRDWIARLSGLQFEILHALATLGGAAATRSLLELGLAERSELASALNELARCGMIREASGVISAHRVWTDAALATRGRLDRITISVE